MSFKFIHKKKPEQKPEQTTSNDINLSQKISPPVTPSTQKKGGFNFIKKIKLIQKHQMIQIIRIIF